MDLKIKLAEEGVFDRTDIAIASFLESGQMNDARVSSSLPSVLSLLATKAFKAGHTALPLEQEELRQLIDDCFFSSADESLSSSLLPYAQDGLFTELLKELDQRRWERWSSQHGDTLNGNYLSLPFSYRYETTLADHILRLATAQFPHVYGEVTESRLYEESGQKLSLNDQQKAAVEKICSYPLSVVSGGPGTGKTHTAGVAIALLVKRYILKQAQVRSRFFPPYRILVLAPTGKAVYNLQMSIRRALLQYKESLGLNQSDYVIEAKTVHKYLWDHRVGGKSVPSHVMIMDECSMIDTHMMSDLLSMTQSGTRIVMLGDPFQLPPIQAGTPFSDILKASSSLKSIAFSHLTESRRTESQEILGLAQAVLSGNEKEVSAFFENADSFKELSFLPIESQEQFISACRYLEKEVVNEWSSISTVEEGLALSTSKKMLFAEKRGCGMSADSFNRAFSHSLLKNKSSKKSFIEPIIITKNRYQLDCMNGDIGIQESRWNDNLEQMEKLIHLAWKESGHPLPASLCPEKELGYAMTVHKSQGSEFSHVYFIAGNKSFKKKNPLLTRPLLYTAITRAKRRLTLLGSRASFFDAVKNNPVRYTALSHILQKKEEEILSNTEMGWTAALL